jgi:oligopeptide/dipeptide ABC transporter ATP-binding protein
MERRPDTTTLAVDNLSVEYATPAQGRLKAVDGVSLNARAGTVLALVGESGCGKSSLARAVVGLTPVSSGRITPHPNGRDAQLVFQDASSALSPRRRIGQSIREPLDHFGIGPRSSRGARVLELAALVGLDTELLNRHPSGLSGGQCQRAAIARALAAEPRLLIADESLSSLDAPTREQMLSLFRSLKRKQGLSILMISHDLATVRAIADDVAVMYSGRLLECGPAQAVFETPAHPYTQALVRATPIIAPGRRGMLRGLPGEPPSPLTPPPGCVFHSRCAQASDTCRQLDPEWYEVQNSTSPSAPHEVRCVLYRPHRAGDPAVDDRMRRRESDQRRGAADQHLDTPEDF